MPCRTGWGRTEPLYQDLRVLETQAALGSAPLDLCDITASVEVAVAVDSPEVAPLSLL